MLTCITSNLTTFAQADTVRLMQKGGLKFLFPPEQCDGSTALHTKIPASPAGADRTAVQSARMPMSLITLPHLAISDLMVSAATCEDPPVVSLPPARSLSRISGVFSTWLSA